jgi:hypothetical protein
MEVMAITNAPKSTFITLFLTVPFTFSNVIFWALIHVHPPLINIHPPTYTPPMIIIHPPHLRWLQAPLYGFDLYRYLL